MNGTLQGNMQSETVGNRWEYSITQFYKIRGVSSPGDQLLQTLKGEIYSLHTIMEIKWNKL